MSGSFIDFEEVKATVKIEDAVRMLGLELKERNGQLRGPCPICEKGGERSLCITPSRQKWYCFGCQTGGDVIALAAHIKGIHPKEAAFFLIGKEPQESKSEQRQKPKPSEGEGFQPLTYLQHDHEAVEALGLEPEDAKRIGAGYAPRGVMRGQVAFPVRDETGKLLGYLGVQEAVLPSSWKF